MESKAWGVAFSGGGQRGFAHIGTIRALEEYGIVPNAITGTSAGSIFGGFWACGKTAAEMTVWAQQLEAGKLLDFHFSLFTMVNIAFQVVKRRLNHVQFPPAVFRGEKFYQEIRSFIGDIAIKDVKVPLIIPTVDLDTGEEVLFTNRPEAVLTENFVSMPQRSLLADAIRASIGVPGVFAPWDVGGRRLIDGGLADNFPVGKLRLLGINNRIAVDVGEAIPYLDKGSNSLPGVVERSIGILTRQLVNAKNEEAEIYIAPDIPSIMIGDFRQNELLLENGYLAAKAALSTHLAATK